MGRSTTPAYYTVIRSKRRIVRADYSGGAYIELTFGSTGFRPTEVINVWDDAGGHPQGYPNGFTHRGEYRDFVAAHVKAWIETNDEEWPEWYEGYLENARY